MFTLAPVLFLCLGSTLATPSNPGLGESALCSDTRRAVLHDVADDGSSWAVGNDWKAHFSFDGAHFIPFLGSDAPHDVVVHFATTSVTVHGVPIEFARDASAQREGDTIRFQRGAFDELYVCATDGVEQTFVFESLPTRDEIVVRCSIDSELAARSVGDHIEFQNERGGVRYSKAIAIDAAGRHVALVPELVDNTITLRVPAEFVRTCELPLSIDPLVQTFSVASAPAEEFAPDAAMGVDGSRCVVWETAWSQTDHDVTVRITDVAPSVDVTLVIDASTNFWSEPKVASIWWTKVQIKYGVVASVGLPTGGARSVRLRTILGYGPTYTPEFVSILSLGTPGDHHAPDIGGDSFFGGPDFLFAVWQRDLPSGDSDIYGSIGGPVFPVSVVPQLDDETPAISKNDGTFTWCVVFERRTPAGDRDIFARAYDYTGTPSALTPISTTSFDDTRPTVSSGPYYFVIAYERDFAGQHDVMLQTFDGTTVGTPIDLMVLEGGANTPLDQRRPSVDGTLSSGFLVAYKEGDPLQAPVAHTRLRHFKLDAQFQFVLDDTLVIPGAPTSTSHRANVASDDALVPLSYLPEFEVVWDARNVAGDSDVWGALFLDSSATGTVFSGCFGDGSNTACPCGSNGGAPAGCPNSVYSNGAELGWQGVPKLSAESLRLSGSRLPSSTIAALFQSDAVHNPALAFGDGLLCGAGNQIRLVTRVALGGNIAYPQGTDPRISIAGQVPATGGTRLYQCVYRNAANFCTAQTWNTTNALTVNWAP